MPPDLASYRESAEQFVSALDHEYYLHLAGHKTTLDIEPIYERHSELFQTGAVAELREARANAPAESEEARRLRYLLAFALDGLLGRETRQQEQEVAGLEATLKVPVDGEVVGYRQVAIEQANEPDAGRRAELEAARDELLGERLNPLHLEALERMQELCRELGWDSYVDAYTDVRGIDMERLSSQTEAFLEATDRVYADVVDPRLDAAELPSLGELRRADLPRFFRSPALDRFFEASRLVPALEATLAGLGIDLRAQSNVRLDTELRPTKSPRAFCSPVHVPGEIYLVIAPVGGQDDFVALFHEAGHTEHYAHVEAGLEFEYRHLGDNSVTESFAFLLEHLTEDQAWLEAVLGVDDPAETVGQARAARMVYLRRYAGKIAYELELQGSAPDLEAMPDRYSEVLEAATRINWPSAAWLADVDPGFYVACYLRAWALETHWRRALRERFGEMWFTSPEAGAWLRRLWAHGQKLDADELLAEELGEELDFGAVLAEVAEWG